MSSVIETSSPGSSASISSPTPTAANFPKESSTMPLQTGKKSQAWIAGAVMGSFIGAAFFTGLGVWLYKRHVLNQQRSVGGLRQLPMGVSGEQKVWYTLRNQKQMGHELVELPDNSINELSSRPRSMMI
jgi:hypothetical protein